MTKRIKILRRNCMSYYYRNVTIETWIDNQGLESNTATDKSGKMYRYIDGQWRIA